MNLNTRILSIFRLFFAGVLLGSLLSCNFSRQIRDGETAFKQKQYARAVDLLEAEYDKTKIEDYQAYRAFLIGLSYDKMNLPGKAIPWYRLSYQHGYGLEALERYARDLKGDGQYDNAIRAYSTLIEQYGTSPGWETALEGCRQAQKWREKSDRSPYSVEIAEFNSPAADYGPAFLSERELLFSSDRTGTDQSDTYWWTGRAYSDVYIYDKLSKTVSPFEGSINSPANEGAIAVSEDGTEIYFTRCSSEDAETAFCMIYLSRKEGRFWTEPEPLPFQQGEANYTSPAILPSNAGILFSSDMEGGQGGYDLYISYRRGPEWLAPEPLPPLINTSGNEAFPGFAEDTLFFSSDGLTGMGGMDIFKTYRRPNGSWMTPANLKAPINSPADDCCLAEDPWYEPVAGIVQAGVFSSSRNSQNGTDDLYYFYKAKEAEEVPAIPARPGELIVELQVLGKAYNRNEDPNSGILALVPLGNARLEMQTGDTTAVLPLDENASYSLEADPATEYEFVASRSGFLNNSYELRTAEMEEVGSKGVTYVVEIVLDPLIVGKEIVLENIYYDFDRWEIREDAKPTLDELAKLLKLNPALRIEMGSHTDCRGIDVYNQELSQKRAQSAVDYLVSKGIDRNRLEARGYGESKPAVDCTCALCSEEEHQRNRRTTFKIL